MAKKTTFDNYRVEADVPRPWDFSSREDHEKMMREASELRRQIQRHCEHEGTRVVFDTNHECEHCGAIWTEDDNEYNGGCCDQDLEGLNLRPVKELIENL